MNKQSITTLAAAALTICAACTAGEPQGTVAAAAESESASVPSEPETVPAVESVPAVATGSVSGTVVETMDSGGYTYALVDTGAEQVWAAGPQVALSVGGEVSFDGSMTMEDYTSPTLERTFDKIFFTGGFMTDAPEAAAPVAHAEAPAEAASVTTAVLTPVEGGVAVADIFAQRADLVGTELAIRGEVVKYSAEILGKNWLHIQDGTGAEGTNDFTVTTDATAAVGDIVVVRGVLVADRDFGYGYLYELIIEDAEVTVE